MYIEVRKVPANFTYLFQLLDAQAGIGECSSEGDDEKRVYTMVFI